MVNLGLIQIISIRSPYCTACATQDGSQQRVPAKALSSLESDNCKSCGVEVSSSDQRWEEKGSNRELWGFS